MVFSYTPKSDTLFGNHKLVLLSIVNGLNPDDLLKTMVFIFCLFYTLEIIWSRKIIHTYYIHVDVIDLIILIICYFTDKSPIDTR